MHKPESEGGTEAALMDSVAPDLKQVCDAYCRTERADYGARLELLFAAVMALAQRRGGAGEKDEDVMLGLVDDLDRRVRETERRDLDIGQQNRTLLRRNEALEAELAAMHAQLEELKKAAEKAKGELEVHRRKFGQIEVDHDLLLHAVEKTNA